MSRSLTYLLSLLLCLVTLLTACQDPEPVHLGFLGGLTGRAAGLGTSGRNGFLLAIEEANEAGGINGKPLVGLIRDTRLDQERTIAVTRELVEHKVKAIVGPMTSQAALSAVPEINRAKIPTISPTVSTVQLTQRADFFFRAYYTNAQAAQKLARHVIEKNKVKSIVIIYDLSNRGYTEDWVMTFAKHFRELGGKQVIETPYNLQANTLFTDLVAKSVATKPDAMLILANAVDTALICQQLAKQKIKLLRYGTGWSYSDDLFHFGGKAVDGLFLVQGSDLASQNPEMQAFDKAYRARFGEAPLFPALHTYDATRIMIAALRKGKTPQEIRQALLETNFKGVQATLKFDPYGDLQNPPLYLARVENDSSRVIAW